MVSTRTRLSPGAKKAAAAAASASAAPLRRSALAPPAAAAVDPPAAAASPTKKKTVRFDTTNKPPAKPAKPAAAPISSFAYEFGGPWGALGIVLGLPVVVMGLYYGCPNYGTSAFSYQACLRWTDLAQFLTQTLPATLRAWAAEAQASPEATGHAVLALLQGLPALLCAKAQMLLAFVEHELWSPEAFGCVVAWFLFQVLLERVLPGDVALGVPLAQDGGKRLPYRINGHLAFWITLLVLGHGCPQFTSPEVAGAGISPTIEGEDGDVLLQQAGTLAAGAIPVLGKLTGFGPFPLDKLYDHFPQFAFAVLIFSFGLAVVLYVTSFRRGAVLAEGGCSGSPIYDFYMGRELNPRTGSFDWKYFCELRPGLIGWVALNLGMLMKHQQLQPGEVSWPLLLVNVFQGWYVLDALLNERAILTTMDITTDGFGFMLAFGDLAWVPFTYSLQARYLVGRASALDGYALAALTGLHLLGYWIFRQANSTKDAFRRDPASVPHIRYLETARGTKLMVSGWWGWARKVNYTGDWLMALAWCLLCGPTHVLPYFYAIYFGVLLAHRAARDDHLCAVKYGADWDRYKKEVKWLFLPGVY